MSRLDAVPTEVSTREKLGALVHAARYRPAYTAAIALLGVFAAGMEAVGLSFILPIIELAQAGGDPTAEADGLLLAFVTAYDALGLPFTLEALIGGVVLVMFVRFSSSFAVGWTRESLRTRYHRELQAQAFENALDAEVNYFDREGSDDIINAIVTQTKYGGQVIKRGVRVFEQATLTIVYLAIGLILAPVLTVALIGALAVLTYLFRDALESGYDVGDRVAQANEELQRSIQAGMQGIRDVKLFRLSGEVRDDFYRAVEQFVESKIRLERNKELFRSMQHFAAAVAIFAIVYAALTFTTMSFGELGVFLFAMFRLAPQVSNLNGRIYRLEGDLPHLVRTIAFIDALDDRGESRGDVDPPDRVDRIAFEDVSFAYEEEPVLEDVSVTIDRGEFVGLVGPSGAGKSTAAALLSRLYEPDRGRITVDGTPIREFDLSAWRSKVAVVRQHPYVFNESLWFNLTIGARDASRDEVERVCELARVDEFLVDLPNGYDTVLGDDGVQLSGGQRQRIALARALLTDAEILVLDEAMSDLDSHLETEIRDAIATVRDDWTVLAIAHSLSTVADADRIYALEDGRLVESGSHADLIREGGLYESLYASQQS